MAGCKVNSLFKLSPAASLLLLVGGKARLQHVIKLCLVSIPKGIIFVIKRAMSPSV